MLKLNTKNKIKKSDEHELIIFGKLFFFLIRNQLKELEDENIKLPDITGIKPLVERIAKKNADKKKELCDRINDLNSRECKELTDVVKNEDRYEEIKQSFEAYNNVVEKRVFNNNDFINLKSFFYNLDEFINARFVMTDELKEELAVYYSNLAEDMDSIKQSYEKMLLTEKEWEDHPLYSDKTTGEYYKDTPFEVHYEKLFFLRKLRLMEKFSRCFEWLSTENVRFLKDKEIRYFEDLF
ncbi:hypothetical protein [Natranaerofaba carboxydovora]|uniref:hypothetical protein n=1 Tax=Natranaerofaba carboxydovora TaxID=2742683 RepID=UPI001F133AD1|nr:hypothetical protein [Natranaerofaba carboxydovora]UMZ73011.1 hypothetical protein ACONDI_00555 [Natranaerofaba carboxydovora]